MTGFNSKRKAAADNLWDKPSVAFDEWWNGDSDESTNPFRLESGAYWAWAGWKAALAQPAQEPEREALKLALITLEGWDHHDKWVWPETALEQVKRTTKEAITAIKEALAQPAQEPINLLEARRIATEYGTPDSQVDDGNLYFALSKCLEHIDAQPAQRTWIWLSDADIAEVVDTTCQYSGGYEEYLIKKAERKIWSMNK